MPPFPASTSTFRLRGDRRLIFAIPIVLLLLAGSGAPSRAKDDPTSAPSWYMVIDWANLLDDGQEQSAINDAWRLNMRGVPAQVVTELAQSTPELARQRAEALRLDHSIESAPGADDGILIYAAVNPADRSLVTMAIAVGPKALPHGGLDEDDISKITSTIVVPQLADGHPARAIVYSLREMIYLEIFTPPTATPLEGWRATLHDLLPWVAPLVAVATAWFAARGIGQVSSLADGIRHILPPLLVALLLGILAVTGRSSAGAFSAIGLLVATVLLAMRADRSLRQSNHRSRTPSSSSHGAFESREVQA